MPETVTNPVEVPRSCVECPAWVRVETSCYMAGECAHTWGPLGGYIGYNPKGRPPWCPAVLKTRAQAAGCTDFPGWAKLKKTFFM